MLFKQREIRGVKLSENMYKCNIIFMVMFMYINFLLRSKDQKFHLPLLSYTV